MVLMRQNDTLTQEFQQQQKTKIHKSDLQNPQIRFVKKHKLTNLHDGENGDLPNPGNFSQLFSTLTSSV
jgi:hypothetical protein